MPSPQKPASHWLPLALASLLVAANLFLFGPVTIYQGNMAEFDANLFSILQVYLLPLLLLVALIFGSGLLWPRKHLFLYVSIVFALGFLLWLQGNIFVWDYGLFGKSVFNWSAPGARAWFDGGVWFVVLASTVIFHKRALRHTAAIVCLLFCVQLGYLVALSVKTPQLWKKATPASTLPPLETFQFSTKQNVIHVILDEMQSLVFKNIIDQNPRHYYAMLSGFTFFSKATGSFPTTIMSIPAVFSGKNYRNDIPIKDFLGKTYASDTISGLLWNNGFRIDFAVPTGLDWQQQGQYTNFYSIPDPYGVPPKQYVRAKAAEIFRIALFRQVPHFLKRVLYYQASLPLINLRSGGIMQQNASRHFANRAFLADLINKASLATDQPVYKFVHLTTTHGPAILNGHCAYAGQILSWAWENIYVQAKCSLDHFLIFLQKLRSLGIYDAALIILHADHGYWLVPNSATQIPILNGDGRMAGYVLDKKEYFAEIVSSALPLLAIKLPHEEGLLRLSAAPAVLTDIPSTIAVALGLPNGFGGRSVFQLGEQEARERKFYYYDTLNRAEDDYFRRLDEFAIAGDPLDKKSWRFLGHCLPSSYYQARLVRLGTPEASRFLRAGWSVYQGSREGKSFKWALGEAASIWLALPKDEVLLTASVKTLRFAEPQIITIRVDGQEIGQWRLTESSWNWGSPWTWEPLSLKIPADPRRPAVSVVEFAFAQYYRPARKRSPLRRVAVLFESIAMASAVKR